MCRITALHENRSRKRLSAKQIAKAMETRTEDQIYAYVHKRRHIIKQQHGFLKDSKFAFPNFNIMEGYFEKNKAGISNDSGLNVKFNQNSKNSERFEISLNLLKVITSKLNADENKNITINLNPRLLQAVYFQENIQSYFSSSVQASQT